MSLVDGVISMGSETEGVGIGPEAGGMNVCPETGGVSPVSEMRGVGIDPAIGGVIAGSETGGGDGDERAGIFKTSEAGNVTEGIPKVPEICGMKEVGPEVRTCPNPLACSNALLKAFTFAKRCGGSFLSAVITTSSTAGGMVGSFSRKDAGVAYICCVAISGNEP